MLCNDGRLFTSTLNGQNYGSAAQFVSLAFKFLFSLYDGSNPFSIPAWFKLDAGTVDAPSSLAGVNLDQAVTFGLFEIRSKDSFVANNATYAANTLILRGEFANGAISGRVGSRDAGFNASSTAPSVSLLCSSDVLDITTLVDTGFSFSIGR